MHAVTIPVYVALRCQVSGARMTLTHCVMTSLRAQPSQTVPVLSGLSNVE